MSSQTPNLNLVLPVGTEKVSRQIINDNNTKIDTAVGSNSTAIANNTTAIANNTTAIAKVQNGLAYIVGNTNTTGSTLSVGKFVYVKGHSTIAEGLRKVTASISANGNITTSNTSACSEGGLNALNSKFTLTTPSGINYYDSSVQQNLEWTLRNVGGLCVGFIIIGYKSTYAGGDGMQKLVIGMPKTEATLQMPIICVAGTNSGRSSRVRVVNDGNNAYNTAVIQFFYSGGIQGVAGETYLIPVCYPLATS